MLSHTGLFLLWKVALQMRIRRPFPSKPILQAQQPFVLAVAVIYRVAARDCAAEAQFGIYAFDIPLRKTRRSHHDVLLVAPPFVIADKTAAS